MWPCWVTDHFFASGPSSEMWVGTPSRVVPRGMSHCTFLVTPQKVIYVSDFLSLKRLPCLLSIASYFSDSKKQQRNKTKCFFFPFNVVWWQIKLTDPTWMIYREESGSWWSSSALFIPLRGNGLQEENKGFSYPLANIQHSEATFTEGNSVSIACSLLDLESLLNLPVLLLWYVLFWMLPSMYHMNFWRLLKPWYTV